MARSGVAFRHFFSLPHAEISRSRSDAISATSMKAAQHRFVARHGTAQFRSVTWTCDRSQRKKGGLFLEGHSLVTVITYERRLQLGDRY